jgi:phosphoenolpyruvate carboxykinase (diphosphate)
MDQRGNTQSADGVTGPVQVGLYINLKLAAIGETPAPLHSDDELMRLTRPMLQNHFQKDEQLGWPLCPADVRIQAYLDDCLSGVAEGRVPRLPGRTLVLDRAGVGRELSLPPAGDKLTSPYLTSYRIAQGVLHNPKNDRRTTKGVFHVVEGGLPVPHDKQAVPKLSFARLLAAALKPPADVLTLPFTALDPEPARIFVSLLLRPLVCPATAREPEKRMEVRFFAPGSLVSNLDFVESVFGNAGDPFLPENDAGLDVNGWSGHTGCVILAPHLVGLKKVDLGLPHYDVATERQRRDGMCYRDAAELYNGGSAFKVTCRDARGVIVTIIADNYYGYCKKEVKTQISFAVNLFGAAEEEHAGGVIAFASYVLGQQFCAEGNVDIKSPSFDEALGLLGDRAQRTTLGYAFDTRYPDIRYVPNHAEFSVRDGSVTVREGDQVHVVPLRPEHLYVLPSGYKVRLEKNLHTCTFRLVGTRGEGLLCHKPCTVSGGGKSEISKSLKPMIHAAPVFVKDFQQDFDRVAEICARDFSKVWKQPPADGRAARPLLSPERSLGSVVKLLTPSEDYTDEHNSWVRSVPQTIRELVFLVKRLYRPEWGNDIRSHFGVDSVNGYAGHELRFEEQKLSAMQLRVGFEPGSSHWRMFRLRPDFHPSDKVQMEDDITASVVVPATEVPGIPGNCPHQSLKLVANCEEYLFQRPDDAIHRGFDVQAEADMATPGTFITNFEPLAPEQAQALVDQVAEFERYTQPMKQLLGSFAEQPTAGFAVSSAHPRLVDGKPSQNPRYLQHRPDRVDRRATYAGEIGARLAGGVPLVKPLPAAVRAVLAGRRANPGQKEIGLPPLAVYAPVHYQELPELFMDFLSSLTGKSPSTTGFGSEGALTKGPFNALWPVVDMNNALVSAILTGYAGYTSVAGYIGPRYRIDHDISMLVPEVWCRMTDREREPAFLIERGYLEKIGDFELAGRPVLASRLGYRITARFVEHFLGRIFQTPAAVFPEEMLRPEMQGIEPFAAGVDAIVETQTQVAKSYFADGSVDAACPPLRALLHVMVHGHYEGMRIEDPRLRALFSRESLLTSDWYQERLLVKQARDVALLERHLRTLSTLVAAGRDSDRASAAQKQVQAKLDLTRSPAYLEQLKGGIGADPFVGQI